MVAMTYEDEKDYIMRMIKEMVRVLFSLALGKPYTQVELEKENKYTVSGMALDDLKAMVDEGRINEAENLLLDKMDYEDAKALEAGIRFYEYVAGKSEAFLKAHEYTLEEVYDGLRQLAEDFGFESMLLEDF